MHIVGPETCPLPEEPALAQAAAALQEAGTWGVLLDAEWRVAYLTDDVRLSNGALRELAAVPLGAHYFSRDALDVMLGWSGRLFSLESYRTMLQAAWPWLVEDAPGGADDAQAGVDPRLTADLPLPPVTDPPTARTFAVPARYSARGHPVDVVMVGVRIRRRDGTVAGTAFNCKPAAGMSVLGTLAAGGDQAHFLRMQRLAQAARHPAAILFGDLEASSPLARRLSTASYFALGRRLVRAADRSVVDAGGMVGRHAGDGVVAFFLAEHAGSESAAARACISAMRALRDAISDVADRTGLAPEDVTLRFGLHWGATLHVGQIATVARAEVNALGDEMNETARIEACAVGGRALASKALIERLDPGDADALGLALDRLTYTALADLTTATEKARRDAPAIAVCEV